jgi:hypothetical protein
VDTGLINHAKGPIQFENAKTTAGSEFTLLNLPFYLVHHLECELDKIFN